MKPYDTTPSKKDRASVCELRKSLGRGCRNCIYDEVCNGDATYRQHIGKEGFNLIQNPDKARKSTRKEPTGACKLKPVTCVESGYTFKSMTELSNMLKINKKKLKQCIESNEPMTLTLTFTYAEVTNHDTQNS